MNCNNCGLEGAEKVCRIESTWNGIDFVSISEALSEIFEVSPLSSKSISTVALHNSIFSCRFEFCQNCADTLTLLYNSYQQFILLTNFEQKVANKIQELENLKKTNINIGGTISKSKILTPTVTTSTPPSNVKRGRPPKIPAKQKKIEALITKTEEEHNFIKEEIVSDQEFELDEGLTDFENEFYFKGQEEGSPTSPMDSSFFSHDQDDDLPLVKSPRPVRTSSAKDKNLTNKFKNESEEDETDELESIFNNVQMEFKDGSHQNENNGNESEHSDQSNSAWEEEVNSSEDSGESESEEDDEEYCPNKKSNSKSKSNQSRGQDKRKNSKQQQGSSQFAKRFHCPECDKIFAHKKSMERHHQQIHLEDFTPFECPTCKKLFSREDHMNKHRRTIHNEEIPSKVRSKRAEDGTLILSNSYRADRPLKRKYDCPVCNETFFWAHIQHHVSTEHGDIPSPWKCTIEPSCTLTYSSFMELSRHRYTHNKNQTEKCPVCFKELRKGFNLRFHLNSIHHVRSDKLVDQGFSSDDETGISWKQILDEQGNLIQSKSKKKHKCPECKKRFISQQRVTEHLISHGIGEKFKCEICSRSFNHLRTLETHMFLHSEDNPFKCHFPNCSSFSRKDHLIRHLKTIHKIVVSEKDLPSLQPTKRQRRPPKSIEVNCPLCDKLVKRKGLNRHLITHSGEKRQVCHICGSKFQLRSTLMAHVAAVHNGERKFPCPTCGVAFKRLKNMQDHQSIHTDDRPFLCSICGKGYKRDKNLKQHMVSHSNQVHKCNICDKVYSWKNKLRNHMKEKHPEFETITKPT